MILNTFKADGPIFKLKQRPPVMTDLNGKESDCPPFTIDNNVAVFYSCAVTYQDQFFVYGGKNRTRQIATVINKSLRNVGTLPFNFFGGSCSSTMTKIILCFDRGAGDWKTCYKTTNPTGQFEETQKSRFTHKTIKIASSECKSLSNYSYIDSLSISSQFTKILFL